MALTLLQVILLYGVVVVAIITQEILDKRGKFKMSIYCNKCGKKFGFLEAGFEGMCKNCYDNSKKKIEDNSNTMTREEELKAMGIETGNSNNSKKQENLKKESKQSDKDWLTTLLLCIFTGGLGIHRFYVGKTETGILYLLTLGGLGIGVIIDLIYIVTEKFEDVNGNIIAREKNNTNNSSSNIAVGSADELKKYKELLDMGAITQEEYDEKKKQLLKL